MYGLAEYYLLTDEQTTLEKTMELFELIEHHSFDTSKDMYFEAFSRDWQRLEDLWLSDKDANEAKTINTHLHILETSKNK